MSAAFFTASPPVLMTSRDPHAELLEAIDDRQRAEGGGLDQRPVNLCRRRVQRLTEQQAGEPRIDEDGAVAVVPVEREQTAFARFHPLEFALEVPKPILDRGAMAFRNEVVHSQRKMSPTAL